MQNKYITDCQTDEKWGKTETFESYSINLPQSFDWRTSNCDEKRSCPCRSNLDDNLPTHITEQLAQIRELALEKYKEVRG